jgi:cyclopropane-fatty-acyl-phospholipid synthase
VRNLEAHWNDAVAATSEGRARVWRLYMTASALAFDAGALGVNQVLLQRPGGDPPPLLTPSRAPRAAGSHSAA